jgi:hypothetical protein
MPNLIFLKGTSLERKLKLETNVAWWFFAFSKNRQFQVFWKKIRIKELVGSPYFKNSKSKEPLVLSIFKNLKQPSVFNKQL